MSHTVTLMTDLSSHEEEHTRFEDHFPDVLVWLARGDTRSFTGVECKVVEPRAEEMDQWIATGILPPIMLAAAFTFADVEDAVLFRLRWA